MMMKLLEIRARFRALYQKFEVYIDPVVKFIVAFIVFKVITNSLGSDPRFMKLPVLLALSLLSAFTPSSVLVLLGGVLALVHVYYVSPILMILAVLIFLILYLFFIRFTPKLGYVLVAVPILQMFGLSYMIPLLMGLFVTPLAILPTGCGVVIFYLFRIIKEAAAKQVSANIDDIMQLYLDVINNLVSNKQMFMTIAVFAVVILVVYLVRKFKFDFVFEVSIVCGVVVNIIGFLIVDLRLDISGQIGKMVLGTLGSAVLVYVIYMFRRLLDYSAAETVQFEDDSYYYFVKAVPKMDVTVPQFHVKHISAQDEDVQEEEYYEEEYEDEEEYQEEGEYTPEEGYDGEAGYDGEEYPQEQDGPGQK